MPRRRKADVWKEAGQWGDRPSPNQQKFAQKMDAQLEMAFEQGINRLKGILAGTNDIAAVQAFKAISDIYEGRERLRAGRAGKESVPLTKADLKAELVDLLRELDPDERAQVYGLVDKLEPPTIEAADEAVLEDAKKLEAV